jgi:hypothetical protein
LKNSILILFGFILLAPSIFGQNHIKDQQKEFFDHKYGTDVLLHEGKIFYPESNIASGNPFWGTENFYEGDIVLKGKKYFKQRMKYNIYSQNFILIFKDSNGAEKQILLDSDNIDSVFIKEYVFIKNPIPKIDNNFVQLVHEGTITCYVSWEKQRTIKSETEIKGYSYSNEKMSRYIIYNSVLYRFRNKRELFKIFQMEHMNDFKQYLSTNNIRIRTVNTQQLEKLILYIEKVLYKA